MGGVPFRSGVDPRRNLKGRPRGRPLPPPPPATPLERTLRQLARIDRPATFGRLQKLRDQDEDRRLALEASKVLAAYSDGEPGPQNVPADGEHGADTQGEDAKILELLRQPEDE